MSERIPPSPPRPVRGMRGPADIAQDLKSCLLSEAGQVVCARTPRHHRHHHLWNLPARQILFAHRPLMAVGFLSVHVYFEILCGMLPALILETQSQDIAFFLQLGMMFAPAFRSSGVAAYLACRSCVKAIVPPTAVAQHAWCSERM